MSLVANKDTILNIDAPIVVIKVISRNNGKYITTISGLFIESKKYFNEENYKKIISQLGKKCAAKAVMKNNKQEKIIQIQGCHTEVIMDYLIQTFIPKEKIKTAGIY